MYIKYTIQCICKIYNVLSNNKICVIFSYVHLIPDLFINQGFNQDVIQTLITQNIS